MGIVNWIFFVLFVLVILTIIILISIAIKSGQGNNQKVAATKPKEISANKISWLMLGFIITTLVVLIVGIYSYWGSFITWVTKELSLQAVEEAPGKLIDWAGTYSTTFALIVIVVVIVAYTLNRIFGAKKEKRVSKESDPVGTFFGFIIIVVLAAVFLLLAGSVASVTGLFDDIENVYSGNRSKSTQLVNTNCDTNETVDKRGDIVEPMYITICETSGRISLWQGRGVKSLVIAPAEDFKRPLSEEDITKFVYFQRKSMRKIGTGYIIGPRIENGKNFFRSRNFKQVELVIIPVY
jgi:heme/copper-type cytochrome/quinol oxidase subunit 2